MATEEVTKQTGIEVALLGEDGNIFNLIGLCMRALRTSDLPSEDRNRIGKAFQEEMFSQGSYDEALAVIMNYFEVV